MSAETPVNTIWHIPDDLWSLIAPILGPEKSPGTRGRKPILLALVNDASTFAGRNLVMHYEAVSLSISCFRALILRSFISSTRGQLRQAIQG